VNNKHVKQLLTVSRKKSQEQTFFLGTGRDPGSSPARHRLTASPLSIDESKATSANAIKNIFVFSGSAPATTFTASVDNASPCKIKLNQHKKHRDWVTPTLQIPTRLNIFCK